MPSYSIVAVSLKTGNEIKRPRAGQNVTYALRSPRGYLKSLSVTDQKYSRTDLEGFNAILARTDGKHFVLFEQLSNETLRVRGKVQYRTKDGLPELDARGRKIPLKKVKLTYKQRPTKQRPVVFEVGRTVKKRVTDYAFRKLSKREQVDLKLARILPIKASSEKPVFSQEIHIQGDTIFATLKNVRPSIDGKTLKKRQLTGLWVEGVIRIRDPRGALAAVVGFSTHVKALWNFSQQVAKEIRYKLADIGYRFTSLADLRRIQEEMDEEGKEADVMRIGDLRKPVSKLKALRPENRKGERTGGKGYDVSISLKVSGYRDPTRRGKKVGGKKAAKKSAKKAVKKSVKKKPKKVSVKHAKSERRLPKKGQRPKK